MCNILNVKHIKCCTFLQWLLGLIKPFYFIKHLIANGQMKASCATTGETAAHSSEVCSGIDPW